MQIALTVWVWWLVVGVVLDPNSRVGVALRESLDVGVVLMCRCGRGNGRGLSW